MLEMPICTYIAPLPLLPLTHNTNEFVELLLFSFQTCILTLAVKESDICHPKICYFGMLIILKLLKKQQVQEGHSDPSLFP